MPIILNAGHSVNAGLRNPAKGNAQTKTNENLVTSIVLLIHRENT